MAAGRPIRDAVDHLLLGAPDLDAGIAWLEARTGIRAEVGGSHPGVGTRNALIGLGARQYLELIAPDPAQANFNFNIDLRRLTTPCLVTWAASTVSPDGVAAAAAKAGLSVFGPHDGSRVRPDGTTLRWKTVGVQSRFAEPTIDPVPFFIQWAPDARHPSSDAPAGCRLEAFELACPEPAALQQLFAALGLDGEVARAPHAALTATLATPNGRVRLE